MSTRPIRLKEIYFEDEVPETISCESGRGFDEAIVIKFHKSPAEKPMAVHLSVIQKEYQIVRHMVCKCGKTGHAQVVVQMNLNHHGKSYDVLQLKCPDTGEVWTVYFDVTDIKKFISSD